MHDTHDQAQRFADADANGDQQLDFDEFYSMMPEKLRSEFGTDCIREWFDAADTDSSGQLSISEYFLWTLKNATSKYGDDVMRAVFFKYDPDESGVLDLREFQKVCDDTGFGLVANSIFQTLDPNRSGTISYQELVLGAESGQLVDDRTQRMLSSLIQTYNTAIKDEQHSVDTTNWKVTGDSIDELRTQMRKLINDTGAPVIDIVRKFDVDAERAVTIDQMEFLQAMRTHFGYRGRLDVVDQLFSSLDTDGSGVIGFDELYEFIRGKRHSLDKRSKRIRDMTLEPPPNAGYALEDIAWDEAALQLCLHKMMMRHGVSSYDVIRAWDKNGNRELEESEFLSNIGSFFRKQPKLWKVGNGLLLALPRSSVPRP